MKAVTPKKIPKSCYDNLQHLFYYKMQQSFSTKCKMCFKKMQHLLKMTNFKHSAEIA